MFFFGSHGYKRRKSDFLPLPKKTQEEKHFVITDGSLGIGKHVLIYLLNLKAEVTVLSRRRPNINHQNMKHISVDLADYKSIASIMSQISPVNMLLNNAGGMPVCRCREGNWAEDIHWHEGSGAIVKMLPSDGSVELVKASESLEVGEEVHLRL